MGFPGKTRQFPFLAVTTLSVAAVGVTAPAWLSQVLARAGHATTNTAPHRPAARHPDQRRGGECRTRISRGPASASSGSAEGKVVNVGCSAIPHLTGIVP